ncbi:LysR family transcriptional regulator [Desulfovibrio sp. OttesenSCG-928-C06]|nr:LysR family transcriptional regulator [Desulfovibrio sp. OttesenSCG-928-C06]
MNLNQLSVFYLAARYRRMTEAARALYVSTPAVTMQIKKLENWLGFTVFERGHGELVLTERGRELYEKIEPIFSQLEDLERYLESAASTEEMEVRFGFYHIAGIYFVPDLIAHVRSRFPKMVVKMEMGTKDVLLEKLAQQQVDAIMIIGKPPAGIKCKYKRMFDEELALITAKDGKLGSIDSISVKELDRIPLMLQQEGTGALNTIREFLEKHQVEPNILIKNISSDVTRQFMPKMLSAAFVGRFIIQKELASGKFHEIRIKEGNPAANYYLVYPDTPELPEKLDNFIEGVEGFAPRPVTGEDKSF